jgi:hypothetical protein
MRAFRVSSKLSASPSSASTSAAPLIVKDDVEQRTMHLQPAAFAVVHEA